MSFFGIDMATRSLLANQRELEITGQNIANVDTPGYSRQVAVAVPLAGPGAQGVNGAGNAIASGGGVDVALVQRTHAAWLDRSAAAYNSQVGQTAGDERQAQQVEGLLGEPGDTGLQATLDRFFTAFTQLANHPDDLSARAAVTQAGTDVANRFQQLTGGLDGLRQDVVAQAKDNVDTINRLAQQVAGLNHTISAAQASGASPNELLDQRDQLLQELTQRTGATVTGQDGGQVIVSLGGTALVQGDHAGTLDLAPGKSLAVTLHGSQDVVTIPGGELRSEEQWANTTLPGYQSRLASVRDGLASAVNALHQSGKDLTGAPGQAFFVTDGAGNLSVNPALSDPRKVAAGDGTAGDGKVALALANLRTAPGTVLPAYRSLVADIGAQVSESRQLSTQAQTGRQQIQSLQSSESGVNLDEELAQMTSLQHAYAASARLLSVYDSMLSTLIDHTGV